MNRLIKSFLLLTTVLNVILRFQLVKLFSQYPIRAMAPGSDESGYINLGFHLWEWMLHGNAVKVPLYPAFLALFVQNGASETVIYIIQHLLFMGAALTICCVIFTRWNWRLMAFNLIIYYGPFMVHPNGALAETFTASIMLLALATFIKGKKSIGWQLGGAFLFGLLSLSRPNFLLLFPFILAALFVTRQVSWRWIIPLMLLCTLPAVAWMGRNYAVQGAWVFNTTAGHVFYHSSRVDFWDEERSFSDLLGTNPPPNLLVSTKEMFTKNRYFDNADIYRSVKTDYPYHNDVLTHLNYKKWALENYTWYFSKKPGLLLFKIKNWAINWFKNYPTTSLAAGEYCQYRNYGRPWIHSRVIDIISPVAVVYDWLFFPLGLLMIIAGGIMIVFFAGKLYDRRLTVLLYATMVFSLLSPIPSLVGGRFTLIQMLAVIVACLYLVPACVMPWVKRNEIK